MPSTYATGVVAYIEDRFITKVSSWFYRDYRLTATLSTQLEFVLESAIESEEHRLHIEWLQESDNIVKCLIQIQSFLLA